MAYTSKWISESDLQDLFANGEFARLVIESDENVLANKYVYPLDKDGQELDMNGKVQHWAEKMLGHLNSEFTKGEITKISSTMDEGKILDLCNGYYNPETKVWKYSSNLHGYDRNNSKNYVYKADHVAVSTGLPRSLGAEQVWFYSELGSKIAFRLINRNTYTHMSHVFDFSRMTEGIETVRYYTKLENPFPDGHTPTIDGSTLEDTHTGELIIDDHEDELHIAKIPFQTTFTVPSGVDTSE